LCVHFIRPPPKPRRSCVWDSNFAVHAPHLIP